MPDLSDALISGDYTSLRRLVFALTGVVLGVLASALACEAFFQVLECHRTSQFRYEGEGGQWIPDKRWGWKPAPGPFHFTTPEFDALGSVNALYMNDTAVDFTADGGRTRVLAVGDSHTFAVGVSSDENWVKVLERELNTGFGANAIRTYNGAVTGFSMHQYLLRLIDQGPMLKPDYVILGLSYATDLYDLLPPDRGGWIYGDDRERDYFDFDAAGRLVERHWAPVADLGVAVPPAVTLRHVLEHFATFRYLRRSNLALFIGSHVRLGDQSLWPNMEIIVTKEPSERYRYQWRLFEALLARIQQESQRLGARLIVVGIPYIAQVYDDIWEATFGRDPRFSRNAAGERVAAYCRSLDIPYVDTLEPLRARSRELGGRRLHFAEDAHPTLEGHRVIARTIVEAGLIVPVR